MILPGNGFFVAETKTKNPLRASCRAVSNPIPLYDPVMRATFCFIGPLVQDPHTQNLIAFFVELLKGQHNFGFGIA